ncbi:hypothetical protein [Caldanaerobacter subterraneus]|uniref:hypothetical protein n=1 Tax=Caldanaerobacter subterraneus TaxID=911092 RepID=UPI001F0D1EB7|nr:hypothetical protein [Caldanaerobacter subterraneus]
MKKAGLVDWFKELSEGFDTKIGQTRKLISGGERSRLSIAMMILFKTLLINFFAVFSYICYQRTGLLILPLLYGQILNTVESTKTFPTELFLVLNNEREG